MAVNGHGPNRYLLKRVRLTEHHLPTANFLVWRNYDFATLLVNRLDIRNFRNRLVIFWHQEIVFLIRFT